MLFVFPDWTFPPQTYDHFSDQRKAIGGMS